LSWVAQKKQKTWRLNNKILFCLGANLYKYLQKQGTTYEFSG